MIAAVVLAAALPALIAAAPAVGYGLRLVANPNAGTAPAWSTGSTMARVTTILASLCLACALSACGGTSGFGSMPFALVMPSGEVLKGSASTQIYKGAFHATNGRVTCSGPFTPSVRGSAVEISASCTDGQRGRGTGEEAASGSGEGTIALSSGKRATFIFGEAARGR